MESKTARKQKRLTQDRLKELLSYDPLTGVFKRVISITRAGKAGDIAGGARKSGYVSISVEGKLYLAHRLAWLYMYGHWPKQHIDHINGVTGDNRIENLRDVSRSVNMRNLKSAKKSNSCGFLGVAKRGDKFRARISLNRKATYLGTYSTPDQANDAYLEARERLMAGGGL